MPTKIIGLLDDNKSKLLQLENELLANDNYQAFVTNKPAIALKWVREKLIDVFASDFNLENPQLNGIDVLRKAREASPELPLALFTYGTIDEDAVEVCDAMNIYFFDKGDGYSNLSSNLIEVSKENDTLKLRHETTNEPVFARYINEINRKRIQNNYRLFWVRSTL